MEDTDELRWAMRVVIKKQMKTLMELLKENGEEVAILAVNVLENTYTHFGSPSGEKFLAEKNLVLDFLGFCKSNEKGSSGPGKRSSTSAASTPLKFPATKITPKFTTHKKSTQASKDDEVDTGKKSVNVFIPKKLAGRVSEQDVAGVVARVVAAKMMDTPQQKKSAASSKFSDLVAAASQMRAQQYSGKRSVTSTESPLSKKTRRSQGEDVTPAKSSPAPEQARSTRSGRKISSKYLDSINTLRGGKHIKTEESEIDEASQVEETTVGGGDGTVLKQLASIEKSAVEKVTVKAGGKIVDLDKTDIEHLSGLEKVLGPIFQAVDSATNKKSLQNSQEINVVVGNDVDKVMVEVEEQRQKAVNTDDSTYEEENDSDYDCMDDEVEGNIPALEKSPKQTTELPKVPENIEVTRLDAPVRKGLIRRPKKRSLTETMMVKCEQCGISVTGKSNLKSHFKRVHLQQRNHKCAICGKGFWSNNARESHMLSVHTRRCDACQEYVVESVPWGQGIDMKTQRDVICTCGAVVSIFSIFGRRRQYLRDDEPDDAGNYQSSRAKNNGTKYACGTCGKLFMKKSNCERHSRAHTDIKCCVCNICGNSYSYESSLKKHLKNEHGIVKCVCSICGGNYSNEVALKVHMVKAHHNVALGDNVAIIVENKDVKNEQEYEENEGEEEELEEELEEEEEEEDEGELPEEHEEIKEQEVQVITDETGQMVVNEAGQVVQTSNGQIIVSEGAQIVETSDGQIVVSNTGEVIQTDGQIVHHVVQDGQVVAQEGGMSIIIKQIPLSQ